QHPLAACARNLSGERLYGLIDITPNAKLSSGGRAASLDITRNQNRGRRLLERRVRHLCLWEPGITWRELQRANLRIQAGAASLPENAREACPQLRKHLRGLVRHFKPVMPPDLP